MIYWDVRILISARYEKNYRYFLVKGMRQRFIKGGIKGGIKGEINSLKDILIPSILCDRIIAP